MMNHPDVSKLQKHQLDGYIRAYEVNAALCDYVDYNDCVRVLEELKARKRTLKLNEAFLNDVRNMVMGRK